MQFYKRIRKKLEETALLELEATSTERGKNIPGEFFLWFPRQLAVALCNYGWILL